MHWLFIVCIKRWYSVGIFFSDDRETSVEARKEREKEYAMMMIDSSNNDDIDNNDHDDGEFDIKDDDIDIND